MEASMQLVTRFVDDADVSVVGESREVGLWMDEARKRPGPWSVRLLCISKIVFSPRR